MRITLICLLPLLLPGCFGPKSSVVPVRWFSAEVGAWDGQAPAHTAPHANLVVAGAGSHLTTNIAWRKEAVEYGFYDLRRWTESPRTYLERAVRTLPSSLLLPGDGRAELYLEAFEEDLREGQRHARVRLWVERWGGDVGRVDGYAIEVRQAVEGAGPEALARAMREALRASILEVLASLHSGA